MAEVSFSTTFGDYLANPEPSTVKDLFYNRTLREWDGGSTESNMSYENGSFWANLMIMAQKDHGFALLYTNSEKDEVILTEGVRATEIIQAGLGDTYFFSNQLVPKETAWKAVEHFMRTGEPLDSLNWQKYEVPNVEFAEVEAQAA